MFKNVMKECWAIVVFKNNPSHIHDERKVMVLNLKIHMCNYTKTRCVICPTSCPSEHLQVFPILCSVPHQVPTLNLYKWLSHPAIARNTRIVIFLMTSRVIRQVHSINLLNKSVASYLVDEQWWCRIVTENVRSELLVLRNLNFQILTEL